VLTKSKGVLLASALALAAAGGSVAIATAGSAGPVNAASAALPVPVGSPVTATMPGGRAGGADGTGSGSAGNASSGGTGSGSAGSGSAGSGSSSSGGATGSGGSGESALSGGSVPPGRSPVASVLPAVAGQGQAGPLAVGTLPADGAVPGASQTVRALAAARRATTALPHSPELLGQLGGPGGWAGPAGSGGSGGSSGGSGGSTASASPSASTDVAADAPQAPADGTAATATPTATATATPAAPTVTIAPTGVSQPPAAPLAGIDVAAYQHPVTGTYPKGVPINWQQVAAAGYRYAWVKGTEGDYYVNPWASTDLAAARAAGLDVAPYHFAIPNVSSGAQQAEYAVEYSGYQAGRQMLPLTLDIEYDPYVSSDGTNMCYGLSATQMTSWISAFVSTVRSLTGQYPIIYTTANWWDSCTGGSTAFGADPMWVAAYGFASPPLPAGWASWSWWQYTSGGHVPGVDSPGTTDVDSFSTSAVALIDPGALASRPLIRISLPIGSLGALAGETLTWSASGLPPGLRVTTSGVLNGIIARRSSNTASGPIIYHVTVTAKNAGGGSSTVSFTWQVAQTCPNYLTLSACPSR